MGHGLRAERRRAPRAARSRLRVQALEPSSPARWSLGPRSPSRRPTRSPSRRPSRGCARKRRDAQPSGIKTFGSTFKNPEDPRAEGKSAGVLLDSVGARGLGVGGARFSEKHANFVDNTGEATTADILALMAEGRRLVWERYGVLLEPEVQVLGEAEWPENWEPRANA